MVIPPLIGILIMGPYKPLQDLGWWVYPLEISWEFRLDPEIAHIFEAFHPGSPVFSWDMHRKNQQQRKVMKFLKLRRSHTFPPPRSANKTSNKKKGQKFCLKEIWMNLKMCARVGKMNLWMHMLFLSQTCARHFLWSWLALRWHHIIIHTDTSPHEGFSSICSPKPLQFSSLETLPGRMAAGTNAVPLCCKVRFRASGPVPTWWGCATRAE